MMGSGQMHEAFEKYYAGNVQIHEMPNGEHRNGKDAQREAIKQWEGMVQEFHGSGVNAVTTNEEQGTACIESWTEVTFQGAPGPIKMQEVAVQQWENGQIVQERFYYHNPMAAQQMGQEAAQAENA